MTKKLTILEKKNRKPASRACIFCHEKHLQCSNERPCKNCVKRNIGHECQDIVRKRAKYMNINKSTGRSGSVSSTGQIDTTNDNEYLSSNVGTSTATTPINFSNSSQPPQQVKANQQQPQPEAQQQQQQSIGFEGSPTNYDQMIPRVQYSTNTHNPMLNTTNDVLNRLLLEQNLSTNIISPNDLNPNNQDPNDMSLDPSLSNNSNINFSSNYLNQEYLMLGDIILHSKPSSPSPSNTSVSEYNNPSNSFTSPAGFVSPSTSLIQPQQIQPHQQVQNQQQHIHHKRKTLKDSRPFIALGFSNSFMDDEKNNSSTTDFLDNNSNLNSGNSNSTNIGNNNVSLNTSKNPIMKKLAQSATIPTEYISPLVTHHLYQSVQDIYTNNIMNFEYPHSYHSLTFFLKKRFSGNNLSPEEKQVKRSNLLIILKLIASYRPTFISAHKSLLKPYDLQFLEMCFQRSLIDYEKLSQLNSSPTIIWRRTGEIVSITDDLLSLLGYNLADIISKRTFIMELMYDDESIINYFKLFKSVAIGNLNSSIFTKCKLIKNQNKILETSSSNSPSLNINHHRNNSIDSGGDECNLYIEFCSVWTVKRDLFDIPMLIIGQFLPILPAGDGVRMY
ncbi:zinc finger transcription factor [Scheffersomyces coipomensis]|uniref:zinc finger transcription factor n=1 Tax=Scheffersomyces coipomensis TaxID=1788519 RepID=UPI00315C51DC